MSLIETPQFMKPDTKTPENELEILTFTDLGPVSFTYDIEARVSSSYDDYDPLIIYNFKLEIDLQSDQLKFEKLINVDNQHSNWRHYHGIQHAVYPRGYETIDGTIIVPKLEFFTYWNRAGGLDGYSNRITFSGDTKCSACQLDRDSTVRVRLTFTRT